MVSTVRFDLQGDYADGELRASVTEFDGSSVPWGLVAGSVVQVSLRDADGLTVVVDQHLRQGLDAPIRRRMLADVLVGPSTGASPDGGDSARRHPGALVVAVHDDTGCRLWFGAGSCPSLSLTAEHVSWAPWEVWASLAHTLLVAGLPADRLGQASGCSTPGG